VVAAGVKLHFHVAGSGSASAATHKAACMNDYVYLESIDCDDGTVVVLAGVVTGEHVTPYALRGLHPPQVEALLRDIDAAEDIESLLITWATMIQMEESCCPPKD